MMKLKRNNSVIIRCFRASLLLSTALFIRSCSPDPSLQVIEDYSLSFGDGDKQKVFPGDKLTVTLSITDRLNGSTDPLMVTFDIKKGDGSLSDSTVYTDTDGKAITEWIVGGGSTKGVLRASIYKSSGKYLTYRDLTVTCFTPGAWNVVTDLPDGHISDMVSDTVNHLTFMVSGGNLYRQGDRYFTWEKIADPLLTNPRNIEIDSKNVIYVSNSDGNIMKSTDHGLSWEKCTKPYPEDSYYVYMTVSNDNFIWAGKFDYPTRFSKDGGTTWQNAGNNISTFLNGNTFRLKDGTIVNHGTKGTSRSRLNISTDDGSTWVSRETPGYSTVMYVNGRDEVYIATQENGFSIYQTTDLGLTFKKVHNVQPRWGTIMENNNFTCRNGIYYIIVPGYGILRSADLVTYEDFWLNSDLIDLFIDSNGVLIARDHDWNTVYYYKSLPPDPPLKHK